MARLPRLLLLAATLLPATWLLEAALAGALGFAAAAALLPAGFAGTLVAGRFMLAACMQRVVGVEFSAFALPVLLAVLDAGLVLAEPSLLLFDRLVERGDELLIVPPLAR